MFGQDLKALIYSRALAELRGFDIPVVAELSRPDAPWGAYIRIEETALPRFIAAYWQGLEVPTAREGLRLDPKILIVAPGARLSLQYHHRRSEHWRVLDGPVGIVTGTSQDDLVEKPYRAGEVVRLACGEWHRLVGLEGWGRIAEIWQHSDAANPSDESDIIRVQDDYGR